MGAVLDKKAIKRIADLCGRFGSEHEGERSNAARFVDRLVRQHGLDWHAISARARARALAPQPLERPRPPPWRPEPKRDHRERASALLDSGTWWSARNREFLSSLAAQSWPPSDKQLKWLTDLEDRAARWAP